jgi:outer membrane lipoprotein carrier protein
VWIYDKDLNQVTVRRMDVALGSTPAALLAGSSDIDKSYALTATGNQDGLDWIEAVPRARDSTFEKVRLGFSKSGLEAMELRDQFGHVTVIKFSAIERNAKIAPETFRFTPPKGADVISDQK